MPKIPSDISGRQLTKILNKFEYKVIKQTRSHIKLLSNSKGEEHKITIPDHQSIKIGTLNNILNDLSKHLKINKHKLIEELF